jgi:hypothetical protein
MKNFLKNYWVIVFFVLFCLIPVFWTSFDKIIAGGDDIIFLNPASYFDFTAFNNSGYFDNFNSYLPRIFPFGFFWWFFQSIGLGNPLIQKIWLWSMWFIGCLSIYYLAKTFFPKNYKLIGIFSAVFYFLNPFTVFIPLTIAIIYTHTFLPLILAVFIRGIQSTTKKQRLFYAILFGLSTLLASSVFASPPNALVLMLPPILYFLFSAYIDGRKNLFGKIYFSVLSFLALVLFNLYYIWSTFYIWFFRSAEETIALLGSETFKTTSIFDVFRTLGCWAFASNPLNTYEKMFYDNFTAVFFSYFLVLIAFFSIFFIRKNKNVLFLLLATAIFMFFVKGTLAPMGDLYEYFFNTFNFFKGFREPWTKFSPPFILAISVLFGYSCYKIIKYLEGFETKIWTMIFSAIIFLAFLSVGYPSITGKNNWDFSLTGAKSTKVKVPVYWNDMAEWFQKNDPNSPVLVTPKDLSARDYEWESGISSQAPLEVLLLKNPLRYPNYLIRLGIPDFDNFFIYFNSLSAINSDNFYNYLNLLGAKYIIQENDVNWRIKDFGFYSPEIMKEVLGSADFLEKPKTFGKIDVYEVKKDFQKSIAYASRKIIIGNGPAYAFSSWNKRESDNISLISNEDVKFKTDSFEVANQAFPINNPASQDPSAEKSFDFKIERAGEYDIAVKIADKGKIDEIPISYKISNGPWQEKNIKIERNQIIKRDLDKLGYVQVFSDFELGKANFEEGPAVLKIKSNVFGDKNFGGIIYAVLNRHFPENEEKNAAPEIRIEKVSDTKYIFDVKAENNKPYILNFALNFDKDWKLYSPENEATLLNPTHFKINGGTGNGWYVSPEAMQRKNDHRLIVEYRPQQYFVWFLWISILSVAAGVFTFLKLKISKDE